MNTNKMIASTASLKPNASAAPSFARRTFGNIAQFVDTNSPAASSACTSAMTAQHC